LGDPSLRSGFRQKGSRSPKCGSLTPSKRQMRSERGLFPFGDRQVAPDRRVVAMRAAYPALTCRAVVCRSYGAEGDGLEGFSRLARS